MHITTRETSLQNLHERCFTNCMGRHLAEVDIRSCKAKQQWLKEVPQRFVIVSNSFLHKTLKQCMERGDINKLNFLRQCFQHNSNYNYCSAKGK